MRLKLLTIALLAALPVQYARAGMFSDLVAKAAKALAPAAPMVSSLSDVSINAVMESNLAPTELGTISQSFIPGWKTGGDAISLMFTKKTGAGFYKIDGTVSVDGKPADYLTIGNYTVVSDPSPAPRRIEIVTKTGEKESFTIAPSARKIKLLSVNGEKDGAALDLSKDVVLELEGTGVSVGSRVKISLAINQAGIKSMYEVCYVRYAPKVTIPTAAFRNINIVPGGSALYSYKKSFLSVQLESLENATDVSGSIPAIPYTSLSSDGKFVDVRTEPELNTGLMAKGTETPKNGEVTYSFFKPNAFRSRPTDQVKKLGVLTAAVSGKTYDEQSVIVQEQDNTKEKESDQQQITKTTTLEFPQQTDAAWGAVLNKMEPAVAAIVQSELGVSVLPVESVTKSPSYQTVATYSVPESNTKEGFLKTYRGTKVLAATVPVDQTLGVNAINERILREAGADALMTLTFDLQVGRDGDFGVMTPTLTCEVTGKINGLATPTKYFTGTVTGKGIRSDKIGLSEVFSNSSLDPNALQAIAGGRKSKVYHTTGTISPEELDAIVRQSDLLDAFRKGLQELMKKEKADGDYVKVWSLQD